MIPRRPLLAATIENSEQLKELNFPIWLSEKKNGIRGITDGKGVLTRYLKRIRNRYINSLLSGLPSGVEGEIVCKDKDGEDFRDLEDTNSAVMSSGGVSDFTFYVFDWYGTSKFVSYRIRTQRIDLLEKYKRAKVVVIGQHLCEGIQQIHKWYDFYVKKHGAEGVMLRDPNGFYKFGRSTLNEQLLIKYKPWNDDEAKVIGIIEEMKNQNIKTTDLRGLSKRSKHIANLQGKGTMGALLCKNKRFGEFQLGSGFTKERKQQIWDEAKEVFLISDLNLKLRFRYRGVTKYGKPRNASFVSWI